MSAVVKALNIILILLLAAAGGIIVRRVVFQRRLPVALGLFLILPVGQLFMLFSFSYDGWSIYWLLGLLLSVAASVLFLFYAISQEKKIAAVEELQSLQHRMELEQSYYVAVEQRRKELEKIRNDFNAKMDMVAGFVHSGEDKEARENISALAEKINGTRESVYCNIPVINALLTQKEVSCKNAGIELIVNLELPNTLAVESIHLCSIFGNILDNAIDACQKLKDTEKPVIRLSSIMEGDYLFIKATNPSEKPNPIPVPGRGYGRKILSELASRYDGSYSGDYSHGVYKAIISLAVVKR